MMVISLGGVSVYGYGAAIAFSALLSLIFAGVIFKRSGLKKETLSWFALFAVPFGFLMSRVCYVLSAWDNWLGSDLNWFFQFALSVKDGGYLLYGTMLGCFLAVLLTARITAQPAAKIADAVSAPAALMIALSRLCEGLAGEGYGWEISQWFNGEEDVVRSLFTLEDPSCWYRFPLAVQNYYGEWHWAVFVLEALIAFAICLAVLECGSKKNGGKAWLFVMLYAASQAFCESLRQDSVLRWGFVRASQIYSALILLAVMILFCRRIPAVVCPAKKRIGWWVELFAGAGIVLAAEFMVEKKITALEMVPNDLCYVLEVIGVIIMFLGVLKPWKLLFGAARDEEYKNA